MTTDTEKRSALTIVLMAAFADGAKDERERAAVRQVAASLGADSANGLNVWDLYQDVIAKRVTLAQAAAGLKSRESRLLAYEMAVGVCDTDGLPNEAEKEFLRTLRHALELDRAPEADPVEKTGADFARASAEPLPAPPPPLPTATAASVRLAPVDSAALDKMILNYAILNGAVELLPQSLATMAVVPLQMKMVYRVGKAHGYDLDRGHIRDFLATAGVGLAAQTVEGYARKLLGGLIGGALGGGVLGGMGKAATRAATGVAFSFAATYALGQLSARYYAGGRRMEMAVLKETYQRLLADGQRLFTTHSGDIQRRAATLTPAEVINLVRSPT
ncbi:MAG TPA: DUF533 domain-containing protein [Opitutaceae bacterium]